MTENVRDKTFRELDTRTDSKSKINSEGHRCCPIQKNEAMNTEARSNSLNESEWRDASNIELKGTCLQEWGVEITRNMWTSAAAQLLLTCFSVFPFFLHFSFHRICLRKHLEDLPRWLEAAFQRVKSFACEVKTGSGTGWKPVPMYRSKCWVSPVGHQSSEKTATLFGGFSFFLARGFKVILGAAACLFYAFPALVWLSARDFCVSCRLDDHSDIYDMYNIQWPWMRS